MWCLGFAFALGCVADFETSLLSCPGSTEVMRECARPLTLKFSSQRANLLFINTQLDPSYLRKASGHTVRSTPDTDHSNAK